MNKTQIYSLAALIVTGGAFTSCNNNKESDNSATESQISKDPYGNVALFESTRSKVKFALAFVENYYPYTYWCGEAWTSGHGLTVLYDKTGHFTPVKSSTPALNLAESDVYKGRYLTFEILPDIKDCITVPMDENTLITACVLRYCIGHENFKKSKFVKQLNAGKSGKELAKTLTGWRKQPGVQNRCYFFAALMANEIKYSDLLDLRAEGCYNLEWKDIFVYANGQPKCDKNDFLEYDFSKVKANLKKAKEPRQVPLKLEKPEKDKQCKTVVVNCKLVKEIVPDYIWDEVSSGKKSCIDENTLIVFPEAFAKQIHSNAIKQAKAGDISGALIKLDTLVGTSYDCAQLENDISYLKYQVQDYRGAAKAARTALSMSSERCDSAAAYYNQGVAYAANGRLNDAKKCLNNSLQLQQSEAGKESVNQALKELDTQKSKRNRYRLALLGTAALGAGVYLAARRRR